MMFDSIWHLRGSIALDDAATDVMALGRVERLLREQRKRVTDSGPDHVAFTSPYWRDPFRPNWLAMIIYDRGRFWIAREAGERLLHYELRSLHSFVFCLLVAVVGFLVFWESGGLSLGLVVAGLSFGWLYGMNALLAHSRVPGSVRKAIYRS